MTAVSDEKKQQILVVDDDKHLLRTLSDYLGFEGYDVVPASSAEEALRKLETVQPDLVILDISMPGIGGIGFLKNVSSPDGTTKYPVLVLTARAVMEQFFDQVDVDEFMAKPCAEEDLLRTVKTIIARRKVEARKSGEAPREILLGEDDAEVAAALKSALERAGYSVQVIDSGPEVFESATAGKPDAIVVKEILPGMNGSVIASVIKASAELKGTPVVLYDQSRSAADNRKFRREAPVGVTQYVPTDEATRVVRAVKAALE